MPSHFSHGEAPTYYSTQISSRGGSASSDFELQHIVDDLQRKAEEKKKSHQEEL